MVLTISLYIAMYQILNLFFFSLLLFYRRRTRSENDPGVEDGPTSYARSEDNDNESTSAQQQQSLGENSENQQQQQHQVNGESNDDPEEQKRVAAAVQVQVQGMEGDWRAYCEHPLSVATAAMLNLQQQHQVTAVSGHPADDPSGSYVYEYYTTKLPDKAPDVKLPPTHEIWST